MLCKNWKKLVTLLPRMWIKMLRVKLFEPWIKMTLEVNTQFEVNQNYLEISL